MVITRTDTKPQMAYEYARLTVELKPWKGKPSSYCVYILITDNAGLDKEFEKLVQRIKKEGKLKRRTIIGWYVYRNEYIRL